MEQLNAAQNTAVGIICGTIEVCIDQPLLYWKNASQQHLPFTVNPKYLYRGLLASIANMATLTGIQFFGTGLIKRMIVGDTDRQLKNHEIMLSAFAGGAISGIACGPLELTMIQQQRFAGNIIGTPARIISTYGLSGICRGMLPSIIREGIFTCGYLGVTPVLEQMLKDNDKIRNSGIPMPILQFGCCMAAGLVASSLSHPADTVKTCMQGDIEQTTYTRALTSLNFIRKRDGIGGLYRGFMWRYGRMGLIFFIF
eukprot:151429_1